MSNTQTVHSSNEGSEEKTAKYLRGRLAAIRRIKGDETDLFRLAATITSPGGKHEETVLLTPHAVHQLRQIVKQRTERSQPHPAVKLVEQLWQQVDAMPYDDPQRDTVFSHLSGLYRLAEIELIEDYKKRSPTGDLQHDGLAEIVNVGDSLRLVSFTKI